MPGSADGAQKSAPLKNATVTAGLCQRHLNSGAAKPGIMRIHSQMQLLHMSDGRNYFSKVMPMDGSYLTGSLGAR